MVELAYNTSITTRNTTSATTHEVDPYLSRCNVSVATAAFPSAVIMAGVDWAAAVVGSSNMFM